MTSSQPDRDDRLQKKTEPSVVLAGCVPAIEVFGRYIDPANGVIYLRIVGIPHPDSPHGL